MALHVLDEPDAVNDLGRVIGHVRTCFDGLREEPLVQVVEYGGFGDPRGFDEFLHPEAPLRRLGVVLSGDRQLAPRCLEFRECLIYHKAPRVK